MIDKPQNLLLAFNWLSEVAQPDSVAGAAKGACYVRRYSELAR
jgi:hypothetical protein